MKKVRKISLVNGRGVATVDACDYAYLSQFRWYLSAKKYAARYSQGRMIYMHHEILPCEGGKEVDHKDRNGLNNRRSNLRLLEHHQNLHNQGARGISFDKRRGKWKARITVKGQSLWLGYFTDEEEAIEIVAETRRKLVFNASP